jgi:hypothetical protein
VQRKTDGGSLVLINYLAKIITGVKFKDGLEVTSVNWDASLLEPQTPLLTITHGAFFKHCRLPDGGYFSCSQWLSYKSYPTSQEFSIHS